MDFLYDSEIICPEEPTHTDIKIIFNSIGIDTRNKTVREVKEALYDVYAAAMKRSPRGRPANDKQYVRYSNYYGNVAVMKKCFHILQDLQSGYWVPDV